MSGPDPQSGSTAAGSTANGNGNEKDKKAVIFIDSLGPDDLEEMPFVREQLTTGVMDAGPVYVTPVVLGSIYTGTSPTTHGLPSVSRYEQPNRFRPAGTTIPEIAAATDQYENVIQFGLPFIVPPQVQPQGNYWHVSEAMGQTSFMPSEQRPLLTTLAPAGALDKPGENLDLAFNLRVDHCMATFGTARNLLEAWEGDVMFLSYRVADSYAHYHYSEGGESGNTYREDLLSQIDNEIRYVANQAEVFVFGDHGAQELEDVFRINRWLIEHGYLDVDIDWEYREKAGEYGDLVIDEDMPGEVIHPEATGVTINQEESVAIGADPFSTGVTLLDGADETAVENLIADLEGESAIQEVAWTTDLFGPGDLQDECPDLYAVREDGVFVSGNLHPDPGGPELTRSGVHHRLGAWGTSDESVPVPDDEMVTPEQLFDGIAREFLGLDLEAVDEQPPAPPAEDMDVEDRDVRDHLADLGYL